MEWEGSVLGKKSRGITYLDWITSGIESFVTYEKVEVLDTFRYSSAVLVTNPGRLLDRYCWWNYELWFFVPSETQFCVSVEENETETIRKTFTSDLFQFSCLLANCCFSSGFSFTKPDKKRFLAVFHETHPVPTSITHAGSLPVISTLINLWNLQKINKK